VKRKKCPDCVEYKNCSDSFIAWIFFVVGVVAALAIRLVVVLMHVNPVYARAAWYVGVGGFFAFFMYKFKVTASRSRAITRQDLVDKIHQKRRLTQEDHDLISAILCSLSSKKEKVNYLVIFGLSAIAILFAVYMDFVR